MFNFAIVEDNDDDARILENNVKQSLKALNADCTVRRYRDAASFGGDGREYDVIFLDIEMPGMNGMELAEKIRAANTQSGIVFVTNMVRYAVQGYSVSPIDYIVKPIERYDFDITMRRVYEFCMRKNDGDSIMVRTKQGAKKLRYSQIRYIGVSLHHITFYAEGEAVDMWGTLGDVEQKLPSPPFFRISSCCIVNLAHVKGIKGYDVDVDGDIVRTGRQRKREFLAALAEYHGR